LEAPYGKAFKKGPHFLGDVLGGCEEKPEYHHPRIRTEGEFILVKAVFPAIGESL